MYTLKFHNMEKTSGKMGEYVSKKEYMVVNDKDELQKVNGYVVQYVVKESIVTLNNAKQEEFKTSADIVRLTNDNVRYMCDSYIERFEIKDGVSLHADAFATGTVAKYDSVARYGKTGKLLKPYATAEIPVKNKKLNLKGKMYDDGDYEFMTKGTIKQTGINLLFVEPDNITALNKLPWKVDYGAANGLEALDASNWAAIKKLKKDSKNSKCHVLTATWEYEKNDTVLDVKYPDMCRL
jgi:hypothetical protein